MAEYRTADGVTITEGLPVWTNNLTRGRITLRGSWEENGKLWFDVIGNGTAESPSRTLQSSDRVATYFPGKGKA
jgi:hypothetical protein